MEQFFKKNSINIKKVDLASNKKGYIIYSDIKIDKSLYKYFDIDFSVKELVEEDKKSKSKNISYQELKAVGEDFVHRFYYYQEIIENNKPENKYHATIIMMNPAFAYSKKQDSTIDNIYNYLKSNNFKSFEIINFSPIRTPSPNSLTKLKNIEKCNQYDEINRAFVETVLNKAQEDENNVIIVAWGGSQKDNKIAKKILKEKSYKLYCFGMTSEKFPKHFSPLSFNNVNKYRHPIPYLEINNWLEPENLSEFDREKLKEIKSFIDWLDNSPKVDHSFIEHHKNLLQKIKDFVSNEDVEKSKI